MTGYQLPLCECPVSIIIVNHNNKAHLYHCLQSVLESISDEVEVIVVDNDSTDGSVEHAADCFPTVRVYCAGANLGYCGGNNLGAEHATGEYLVFLNPDTLVHKGWLEELVKVLDADPKIGLVTPKILMMDQPNLINSGGTECHCSGLTLCRGLGLETDALTQPDDLAAISGAAFAIRKGLFQQLEGFDEHFFLYMEDTDLSWRARIAGWGCKFVPDSVIFHDYTLRLDTDKIFLEERNRYQMLLKILRVRTLFLMIPVFFLAECVTWGLIMSKRGEGAAGKIRAYLWILTRWRLIMANRRVTQRLRTTSDGKLLSLTDFRISYEQVGDGVLPQLAHLIFDPPFYVLRKLSLKLIRW